MPALGLFGGTFDPIHIGHLCMAEWALNQLQLDRIVFIPAGQPPHKTQRYITPNQDRLHMLKAAIQAYPSFEVSTYELEKTEPSYTLNTLKYFRERHPGHTLYFLMGLDSLLSLHTWHQYEAFSDLCKFAILPRQPDLKTGVHIHSQATLDNYIAQHLPMFIGRVHWLNMPLITVSSTLLRQLIQTQHSVQSFLPDAVWSYIQRHGLYYNGDS